MPETRNNREEVFKKKNAQIDQKMENDDFQTPKAAGGSRNNGSATKFLSVILTEIKRLRPYLAECLAIKQELHDIKTSIWRRSLPIQQRREIRIAMNHTATQKCPV